MRWRRAHAPPPERHAARRLAPSLRRCGVCCVCPPSRSWLGFCCSRVSLPNHLASVLQERTLLGSWQRRVSGPCSEGRLCRSRECRPGHRQWNRARDRRSEQLRRRSAHGSELEEDGQQLHGGGHRAASQVRLLSTGRGWGSGRAGNTSTFNHRKTADKPQTRNTSRNVKRDRADTAGVLGERRPEAASRQRKRKPRGHRWAADETGQTPCPVRTCRRPRDRALWRGRGTLCTGKHTPQSWEPGCGAVIRVANVV